MAQDEKVPGLERVQNEKIENVSGGEVIEYNKKTWRHPFSGETRYKVTNNISGKVAKSDIKDFETAMKDDKKLNSEISSEIHAKK